VILVHDPFAD